MASQSQLRAGELQHLCAEIDEHIAECSQDSAAFKFVKERLSAAQRIIDAETIANRSRASSERSDVDTFQKQLNQLRAQLK